MKVKCIEGSRGCLTKEKEYIVISESWSSYRMVDDTNQEAKWRKTRFDVVVETNTTSNVGKKVRCIDAHRAFGITVGQIYTVLHEYPGSDTYVFVEIEGEGQYMRYRFEVVWK